MQEQLDIWANKLDRKVAQKDKLEEHDTFLKVFEVVDALPYYLQIK